MPNTSNSPTLSDSMQMFLRSISRLLDESLTEAYIMLIGGEAAFIERHAEVVEFGGDCGLPNLTTDDEVIDFYIKNKEVLVSYCDGIAWALGFDDTADLYASKQQGVYEALAIYNALDVPESEVKAVIASTGKQGECLEDVIRFMVFNGVSALCTEYAGLLEEGNDAYYLSNKERKLSADDA